MSNMIKAYTVRYQDEMKKTIENNHKIEPKMPLKTRIYTNLADDDSGFEGGITAVIVDPHENDKDKEVIEKANENANLILEQARNEAREILEKAKQDAEQVKNDIYLQAKKKGYEDGMRQGMQEVQNKLDECDEMRKKHEAEYQAMLANLEPEIADLISGLVTKITGILVEDKKDVILYLVEKAISNMDRADEYTIRAGNEDYELLCSKKDELISKIGRDVELYFVLDPSLSKNQCMIETSLRVLDCSLDVQLNNLITDLKLLSGK